MKIETLSNQIGMPRLKELVPMIEFFGLPESGSTCTAEEAQQQVIVCGYADRVAVGVYDNDGNMKARFNVLR